MKSLLAYVFWHWPLPESEPDAYETSLMRFHQSLVQRHPDGFLRSIVFRLPGVPWAATDGTVYEDWYLVDRFAALGLLNEGAVTGVSEEPHDRIAFQAEGGAGGVYRLRAGVPAVSEARHALWFSKPRGLSYDALYDSLSALVEGGGGGLWQRQMVLGPAPEFCLLTPDVIALPGALDPLVIDVERV